MSTSSSIENIIVGGGVIGLSIAYELAKRGRPVAVLEKDRFGRKASWAGAGILAPANGATANHPQEHLEALSHQFHEQWSSELKVLTGIDNGYQRCGGLYVARTAGEVASLTGLTVEWQQREILFEPVSEMELYRRWPLLFPAPESSSNEHQMIRKSIWVPGESQISNPHHLEALIVACRKLGVVMREGVQKAEIKCSKSKVNSVAVAGEVFMGENYFFAAGPWTEQLVAPNGIPLPMQPVRGQIALYRIALVGEPAGCWPIVNEGSRYLVPRRDGHVLAGATIEEVGFECRTTDDEIAELRTWAEGLSAALHESNYLKSWAGLRPGTYDGFAYLGRLGGLDNAFVATGHFKGGLQLSTATAVVMVDLAEGKTPAVDLAPFDPSRAQHYQSTDIK